MSLSGDRLASSNGCGSNRSIAPRAAFSAGTVLAPFGRERSMKVNVRDALLHAVGRVAEVVPTWLVVVRPPNKTHSSTPEDGWTEGCHAAGRAAREELLRARQSTRGWVAGWEWAEAHPDRRRQSGPVVRGYRRSTDRRARLARGARRGIAGLTLLGVGGWWWRRRSRGRTGPESSQQHINDSGPGADG